MLVKLRTSTNQKHWILSRDESELCNPRLRLLGDEVNCEEELYSIGKMTLLIKLFYLKHLYLFPSCFNVWSLNLISKVPPVSPIQIEKLHRGACVNECMSVANMWWTALTNNLSTSLYFVINIKLPCVILIKHFPSLLYTDILLFASFSLTHIVKIQWHKYHCNVTMATKT